MLLHTNCLPTELDKPANQSVIAATFLGCDDVPLTPDTKLAKCSDIPAAQTLTLVGQTLSISGGNSVALPAGADDQQLSISGNVISLTDGGSVTLPTTAAPIPQALSISGNVLSLTNGGSVTLPSATFATPAQTIAGTSTTLTVNPADLAARENMPAQTGVSNDISAIPAPAANQSPWAVNGLGETLHYAPGLGWKIVDNKYGDSTSLSADYNPPSATLLASIPGLAAFTMPRDGFVTFSNSQLVADSSAQIELGATYLYKNGALFGRLGSGGASGLTAKLGLVDWNGSISRVAVVAGDVFNIGGQIIHSGTAIFRTSFSQFSYQYD